VEAPVGDMTEVFLCGAEFLRGSEFDDLNTRAAGYALKE
jgi:hypothetical protein